MACGFDFEKTYGDRGADFIEMHHEAPLFSRSRVDLVEVCRLKPLCANCHRMVHRGGEALTVQALKAVLGKATA